MKTDKKPDYEGFVRHVEEWDDAGIPWGKSDLIRLAEMYNTPVPTYKEIDGIAQGIEFPKDEKGMLIKPFGNGLASADDYR